MTTINTVLGTPNKLRVVHIPQIPMKGFYVSVKDENEAMLIEDTLAQQHLFLYENNVIPDYSNVIIVEMSQDGQNWEDYYNEDIQEDWEGLKTYLDEMMEEVEPFHLTSREQNLIKSERSRFEAVQRFGKTQKERASKLGMTERTYYRKNTNFKK